MLDFNLDPPFNNINIIRLLENIFATILNKIFANIYILFYILFIYNNI